MRLLITLALVVCGTAFAADRDAILDGCASIQDAERRAKCFEEVARLPAQPPAPPVTARQPSASSAAQCEYEAEMAIANIRDALYAGVRKAELMELCRRARQPAVASAPVIVGPPSTSPTDHWVGSSVEKVYYHPSCAEAARVPSGNRLVFIKAETAEERGYRRSTAAGC